MALEKEVLDGTITLYTGPMCASKSLMLIQSYRELEHLKQTILPFVHANNDSTEPMIVSRLTTDEGQKVSVPAIEVTNAADLLSIVEEGVKKHAGVKGDDAFSWDKDLIVYLEGKDKLVRAKPHGMLRWNPQFTVLVDELNFFDAGIKRAIEKMAYMGVNVIAGGLEHNYRGDLFTLSTGGATISDIGGLAHHRHYKLTALCKHQIKPGVFCGEEAIWTQRYRDPEHTEPSRYGDELIIPDKRLYVPVCRHHHIVPGKF